MKAKSRLLNATLGMALVLLVGVSAMAAGEKAQAVKPADGHGQAAAHTQTPAATGTYAPGLPGWMNHLPADMLEKAKSIWLTDGRVLLSTKEMVMAKRHELHAVLTAPASDDKVVQALVKDVISLEEKLLNANITLRRKLEKEGIPTWGIPLNMEGMGAMGGMHGMGGMHNNMHGMGGDMKMGKMMEHGSTSGKSHSGQNTEQGSTPNTTQGDAGQHN